MSNPNYRRLLRSLRHLSEGKDPAEVCGPQYIPDWLAEGSLVTVIEPLEQSWTVGWQQGKEKAIIMEQKAEPFVLTQGDILQIVRMEEKEDQSKLRLELLNTEGHVIEWITWPGQVLTHMEPVLSDNERAVLI